MYFSQQAPLPLHANLTRKSAASRLSGLTVPSGPSEKLGERGVDLPFLPGQAQSLYSRTFDVSSTAEHEHRDGIVRTTRRPPQSPRNEGQTIEGPRTAGSVFDRVLLRQWKAQMAWLVVQMRTEEQGSRPMQNIGDRSREPGGVGGIHARWRETSVDWRF